MAQPAEVTVAMDWGGTWARAAVIDRQGEIGWQSRVRTLRNGNQGQLLEAAEGLVRQAIDQCGNWPVAGIGIAVAGPVDAETGTLHDPPNLRDLAGVSLKSLWEPRLGLPVWVGNDANLAALGEFHYGAGLSARQQGTPPRTLVYVTVSTGIGGGVVDRGRVFLGAHGLAVEVGHMVIDWSAAAPRCTCGKRGCLEALASGTAIARTARTRMAGTASIIPSLAPEGGDAVTSEVVFQAAAQGDALARQVVDEAVLALSVGLTNALHLYNPDLVVLGGGVTEGLTGQGILPRIHAMMLDRAMSERHKDFRLVASRLGDSAGMVGAASLVWTEVDAAR